MRTELYVVEARDALDGVVEVAIEGLQVVDAVDGEFS